MRDYQNKINLNLLNELKHEPWYHHSRSKTDRNIQVNSSGGTCGMLQADTISSSAKFKLFRTKDLPYFAIIQKNDH